MTIRAQILGDPGRDNSVYVEVDSGQSITRLLFDCGYGCLDSLAVSDIQSINATFFSHFHMDHVSGFDALFRHNYNREDQPFLFVGPNDAIRVVTNRLRGYTWNLVQNAKGSVSVREFSADELREVNLPTREAFEEIASDATSPFNGVVFESSGLTVSAIELDHGCTNAGYLVREPDKKNVDTERMRDQGYSPGPWLGQVKDDSLSNSQQVAIGDMNRTLGELRGTLLTASPGSSLAYLTDFRPSPASRDQLVDFIRDVDVLICENNYRDADEELAAKNYHLTSTDVGRLAKDANVGKLILFHLSDRYSTEEWAELLLEVKEEFGRTFWPENWFARGTSEVC